MLYKNIYDSLVFARTIVYNVRQFQIFLELIRQRKTIIKHRMAFHWSSLVDNWLRSAWRINHMTVSESLGIHILTVWSPNTQKQ